MRLFCPLAHVWQEVNNENAPFLHCGDSIMTWEMLFIHREMEAD